MFDVKKKETTTGTTIFIIGDVTRVDLQKFEYKFFEILENSYGDITLNFEKCDYVCSGAIAVFSEAVQIAHNENNYVNFKTKKGMVKRLLTQSGFGEFIY